MNKLYDFIGKWMKLKQAGKEANLVLNTLAGNTLATLSVRLGHGGPSQHTQQKKAWSQMLIIRMQKKWKYEDRLCVGCKMNEETGDEILQCKYLSKNDENTAS